MEEKINLLFIKWIIIKVFILIIFTLSRMRKSGGVGLVSGMEENLHVSGRSQWRPMFKGQVCTNYLILT